MSIRDALNRAGTADPFAGFLACNIDDATNTNYYGYCSPNGAWLIKRFDTSAGVIRYAGGSSGYTSAWSGRVGLSYGLPNDTE